MRSACIRGPATCVSWSGSSRGRWRWSTRITSSWMICRRSFAVITGRCSGRRWPQANRCGRGEAATRALCTNGAAATSGVRAVSWISVTTRSRRTCRTTAVAATATVRASSPPGSSPQVCPPKRWVRRRARLMHCRRRIRSMNDPESHDAALRDPLLHHRRCGAAAFRRRVHRGGGGRGRPPHRQPGSRYRRADARPPAAAVCRRVRFSHSRAARTLRSAADVRRTTLADCPRALPGLARAGDGELGVHRSPGARRQSRIAVGVVRRGHLCRVRGFIDLRVGCGSVFVAHRGRNRVAAGHDDSVCRAIPVAAAFAWRHCRQPRHVRGHRGALVGGAAVGRGRVVHRARRDAARGGAMSDVLVSARDLTARYGRREVFHGLTFDVCANQALGVIGPNGAGKTTLLRVIAGLLSPSEGELRVRDMSPRQAVSRMNVGYFAGDFTLPGSVRACDWGSLATGDAITPERRRIRTLSRGTRQLLGLRTVLSRPHLGLVLLDEPWEALDVDASRWLSRTLETKRDRGASVVLASHDPHDLAGVCDLYLFLVNRRGSLFKAHELSTAGPVTPAMLGNVLERLQVDATAPLRAAS
ncbi:MAG: hypothetical protein DMF87_10845 [Acidobacteria bacterium]|nr:MAG: hypothetical protein DMF87_10845 [Acidobacteriota bacterium]